MRCPYCAEDIKDEAAVCKHCHRDLFVAKRLLGEIVDLSKRLAASENAVVVAEVAATAPAPQRHRGRKQRFRGDLTLFQSFALTYIALVIAHFLIIVHYDVSLYYLRVVSIALPLLFGFLCRESNKNGILPEFLTGFAVAVTAIISMTAVVSEIDKVPFMPRDRREWGEHAYYAASITFGFLTGVILRHMLVAILAPPDKFIEWMVRFILEQFGDGKPRFTLRTMRSMVSSILGFASAIISILTGLWEYMLK